MLLLASQSPRRRQLLALGGWAFQVAPAQVNEEPLPGERPNDYVLRLAEAKARAVAGQARPGWVVVGADTAVVDGPDILGKPSGRQEALAMLERLRGRTHQVLTALAGMRVDDQTVQTSLCVTDVTMRPYSPADVQAYVGSGDPLDKAGAYAIQNPVFRPVAALEGCYANVVGLPLCHLTRLLARLGIASPEDVPPACQQELAYECQIFQAVARGDL